MKEKTKKLIIALGSIGMAILLGLVMTLGVITKGFTQWGKLPVTDTLEAETGGLEVGDAEAQNGIALTSSIMPIAGAGSEKEYTVKATLYDSMGEELDEDSAAEVKLDWSVSWKESTGFASGKTASDYVTASPSQDTHSVTVTCEQAFGTKIVLKASVNGNADVSNSLEIDYRQKYDYIEADIDWGGHSHTWNSKRDVAGLVNIDFPIDDFTDLNGEGNITVTVHGASTYTLPIDGKLTQIKVKSGAKDAIEEAGGQAVDDDHIMIKHGSGYYLCEMFGIDSVGGVGSMTPAKFRAAAAKSTAIQNVTGFVTFTFELTVNGESKSERCVVNFRKFTLSAGSITLDKTSLEF